MELSRNNGMCTAGLSAEPHGWTRGARVLVEPPRPLPAVFGEGWEVVSWDGGPLVEGPWAVYVDGEEVESGSLPFGGVYWPFAPVEPSDVTVPYSATVEIALEIRGVVFAEIEGLGPNGERSVLRNVRLDVADAIAFTQRNDTASFGSESSKYLFWPYQDER